MIWPKNSTKKQLTTDAKYTHLDIYSNALNNMIKDWLPDFLNSPH